MVDVFDGSEDLGQLKVHRPISWRLPKLLNGVIRSAAVALVYVWYAEYFSFVVHQNWLQIAALLFQNYG